MKKYTLFRYPMASGFSPIIHQAFAKQFNIEIEYTQTEVSPGTLSKAIQTFHAQGGQGANVTMPLKEEAYSLCNQMSARATIAGSVNTLFWKNSELWGDNTDGDGLVRDIIQNKRLQLKDKTLCILGAGGAARGILGPLLLQKPKKIILANRTQERAENVRERFLASSVPIEVIPFLSLEEIASHTSLDWIFKAVPAIEFAPSVVQNSLVYDLAYSRGEHPVTAFMQWALDHGATQAFDGLGMLVEQAAMSFSIWNDGKFPDTTSVIELCREISL